MRILVCPAHFTIGEGSGSESETAVKIIKVLSRFADVTVVVGVKTGKVELPTNVRLITLYKGQRFNPSPFNRYKFLYDCVKTADTLLKGASIKGQAFNLGASGSAFDVLYNMFPFDRYHPNFFSLRLPGHLPIIAGPLTIPHNLLKFSDEALGFASISRSDSGAPFGMWAASMRGLATVCVARLARPATTCLFQQSAKHIDTIIAESQAAKNYYNRFISRDKISVVYNHLELEYYPYHRPNVHRNAIAAVGNLIARKGVDRILRALVSVSQGNDPLQLLVIGSGPMEQNLKRQAAALGVLQHIRFLGRVPKEQLPSVLSSCALLVSASYEEAFANTVLEAMALGIPVVAYETASIREIIDSGEDGFVVAQDNEQEFCRRIQLLLSNPSLRFRFGIMGRKKVEQQFSEKAATKTWQSIFERIHP